MQRHKCLYLFPSYNIKLSNKVLNVSKNHCDILIMRLLGSDGVTRWLKGSRRRKNIDSSVLSVPENVCGESWHLVGNSCLKFITAKDSYDNAKLACRSHNAVLSSLTTQKKVDFVLKELQIMSVVVRRGMRGWGDEGMMGWGGGGEAVPGY